MIIGMIQIEALEPIKSHGHVLVTGDRITVDEATARYLCGEGWAKAVHGEIRTGIRRVVRAVVDPMSTGHTHKARDQDD